MLAQKKKKSCILPEYAAHRIGNINSKKLKVWAECTVERTLVWDGSSSQNEMSQNETYVEGSVQL